MSHQWQNVLEQAFQNEVLFDEGAEAARNACVAGASIASAAITAAAYYDNPYTGLPALRECLERLKQAPSGLQGWLEWLSREYTIGHDDPLALPGFGFVSSAQREFISTTCRALREPDTETGTARNCRLYCEHREECERALGPLNATGLSAFVFADHNIDADDAERLFLAWRTDSAIREAQKTRALGLAHFPFESKNMTYRGSSPQVRSFDLDALALEVGLE